MKKIVKQEAPSSFSDYVRKHNPKQWEHITSVRNELRKHLWTEQNYSCAYSEVRLSSYNRNCHIDHFRKRDLYPNLTFDYDNLLVSCNSEYYGAKYKDKHIKQKTDYDDLIDPVKDVPTEYLEYSFTGRILPRNNSVKGFNTIRNFNLNEETLVKRRNTVLFYVRAMKDFTEEEIIEAVGEFETMIRQLYREI